LIDFKQRQPCISVISAEGRGFFTEGGIFAEWGGISAGRERRGFSAERGGFLAEGEDFPLSAKNLRYVRFPRNFAW
jgi:hypothetical protein